MTGTSETLQGQKHPAYVVGIGASAGGLEALERLFERIPSDTGMAYVVVQHLSPDFKSLMDELLGRRTSMKIHRVEDGMAVEANAVYLLPPRKEMIISGGKLLLTDKDPHRGLTLPMDHFFRSLAQDCGRRAIAVVLSGTGSDGSRGIMDVHAAGGLVIAQSERSAKFDGMPSAARVTGVVDLNLDPEEIADALVRYAKEPDAALLAGEFTQKTTGGDSLSSIFALLRDQHGIDFGYYKLNTVIRRTERRLELNRVASIDAYLEQLKNDPSELNSLYRDLLVGVTRFFRDEAAFARLAEEVDELLLRAAPGSEFRAWVAGCATGEEAYSIAMLLDERVRHLGKSIEVRVFATDVHRTSLEHASQGFFREENIGEISADRLQTYFTPVDGGYVVNKSIRQKVVFAPHNVIKDAPFTRMDLITCRNLLIYLQSSAQKKALSLFHFGLKTGGLMFLGPSESTGDLEDEFDVLDTHWNLYRKRRDVRLNTELRDPLRIAGRSLRRSGLPELSTSGARPADPYLMGAYDSLLETFMPAALLFDQQYRLQHVFGDAGRFLQYTSGRVSPDVLEQLDLKVRLGVTAAVRQAHSTGKPIKLRAVPLSTSKGQERVTLTVHPVRNRRADSSDLLITFETLPDRPPEVVLDDGFEVNPSSERHVQALESELRHAKENMQALVEELETSNEELQASNEELVASNEELQSTNEELHSVNEELYTVNAEHQRKIQQLVELTNDMENLLHSTQVHTVFLDQELRIRKFTPGVSEVFHLLPADIGRPLDSFSQRIDRPALLEELRRVLKTGEVVEGEVESASGRWFLLRLLPYESDGQTCGVLLTLVNIDRLKHAESDLSVSQQRFMRAAEASHDGIWDWPDMSQNEMWWSDNCYRLLGYEPGDFPPKYSEWVSRVHPDDQTRMRAVTTPSCFVAAHNDFEYRLIHRSGEARWFRHRAVIDTDDEGRPCRMIGSVSEIHNLKAAELEARERIRQRDQFLATLSHELRNPLGVIANAVRRLQGYEQLDAFERDIVTSVERQTAHMTALLEDLLDVARVTEGKIDLQQRHVRLDEVISGAVELVRVLIDEREQNLELDLPDEPVWVSGNAVRLRQVIGNLLANACKYSPPGETLRLTLESLAPANGRGGAGLPSEESPARRQAGSGRSAVIRVMDRGRGIPSEMLDQIFEPFEQLSTTIDRNNGGLGLGLTLARSLVGLHGGSLTAHSDGEGRGSEFVVTLPQLDGVETPPVAARPTTRAGHQARSEQPRLSIVLVEDNDDARTMLSALLEDAGHQVACAADGVAGRDLILQTCPDVALVDVGLPGMDGYELARAVREAPEARDVLLVALTGYSLPSDRMAAIDAGFDSHLVKPLDFGLLDRVLAQAAPQANRQTTS